MSPHLELWRVRGGADRRASGNATPRDIAILQALDSYRYLDRHQLEGLFFQGPRSCQYRLSWLTETGLVECLRVVERPGHKRRASIYLLAGAGARALAEWRDEDPNAFVTRAEHALSRHHHLVHDLAANQFMVDFAKATREDVDIGLYHWVGEHGIRRAYGKARETGPTADAWGRLLIGHRELFIHLEWDRGTEQTRRLHGKTSAYVSYFQDRPDAACNQVLFVAPTSARERQILEVMRRTAPAAGRPCCMFWTATTERLDQLGPIGASWRAPAHNAATAALLDMTTRPQRDRLVADCVGKPSWWERRPGGGEGA